jgi:NDP-4-keto-2,6-dideoxyhexose 3-C-methyltransferase
VSDSENVIAQPVAECRICGSTHFREILSLGEISLTSVFPEVGADDPPKAPLDLVACSEEEGGCGLVQLGHDVAQGMMFGENDYGYRSGLNRTMSNHLAQIAQHVEGTYEIGHSDWLVDIGGNDGTLMGHYSESGFRRLIVDPTAAQFQEFLPDGVEFLPEYFSAKAAKAVLGRDRAKVVTSIAMFYDLPDPVAFASDIRECLDGDGVWITEQSYLPTMLRRTAYDAICHEHLEYYGLKQIVDIAGRAGLRVLSVSENESNGGSFRVALCHENSARPSDERLIDQVLEAEVEATSSRRLLEFRERVSARAAELRDWALQVNLEGKRIWVYGASTKGNVTLEYSGLDSTLIEGAAERNPRKYGRRTPGTGIPIFPEAEARRSAPDFFLALPWAFLAEFLERERAFLEDGGVFVSPLPELSFFGKDSDFG